MLKIVLNDLFINIKKIWLNLILFLILYVFLGSYIVGITLRLNNTNTLTNDMMLEIMKNNNFLKQTIPFLYGISAVILLNIIKKIPLRLSKAMFVCAAGEKEKMKFIYLQLVLKIIFSFLFIILTCYLFIGQFFTNEGLALNIVQLSLWFFIILDLNLKIGIGEEGLRKKDLEGYLIYSKEEEIVNYYWPGLLIIEITIFYTLSVFNIQLNLFGAIGWLLVFMINSYFTFKCTTPILKKSLSFEDIYRQIPDMKEVS